MPPASLTTLKARSTPNLVICSPVKASGPENEFEPPSRISASVTPGVCAPAGGAPSRARSARTVSSVRMGVSLLLGLVRPLRHPAPDPAGHEEHAADQDQPEEQRPVVL